MAPTANHHEGSLLPEETSRSTGVLSAPHTEPSLKCNLAPFKSLKLASTQKHRVKYGHVPFIGKQVEDEETSNSGRQIDKVPAKKLKAKLFTSTEGNIQKSSVIKHQVTAVCPTSAMPHIVALRGLLAFRGLLAVNEVNIMSQLRFGSHQEVEQLTLIRASSSNTSELTPKRCR